MYMYVNEQASMAPSGIKLGTMLRGPCHLHTHSGRYIVIRSGHHYLSMTTGVLIST